MVFLNETSEECHSMRAIFGAEDAVIFFINYWGVWTCQLWHWKSNTKQIPHKGIFENCTADDLDETIAENGTPNLMMKEGESFLGTFWSWDED